MRLSRSELLFVVTSTAAGKWTEHEILAYLEAHPQRAFFSRLFRDGGFTNGMEVGVAGGRFSDMVAPNGVNVYRLAARMSTK